LKVGLGLPNSDKSLANGRLLVEIARRAETLGFSTLGTIGRVGYPTYEELVVLAAAAGATERIGLMTDVLLATTREPVMLAKQAATLDQVSHGRFVLGVGVGQRPDDFEVTGFGLHDRGKRMDAMLDLMHRAWRGEPVAGSAQPVTPRPVNGHSVPVMIGGHADRALARLARYGIGYTLGGGTPENLKAMMERVDAVWKQAGREGKPRYAALRYFALGDEVASEAEQNIKAYYGDFGSRVLAGTARTAEEARQRVKEFEETGVDELILFMAAPAVEQAERLAEAVL
jgi:alkanesulfonate monooxygenase SsuD/methylene tetrahydromethanopterin reductase-like flavin-dependent oxidoreductase (luciferase family)